MLAVDFHTCLQAQALVEWLNSLRSRGFEIDYRIRSALFGLCHDGIVRQDSNGRLSVNLNQGDSGLLGIS